MDHRLKRFTKEGCFECRFAICDECGPSKERLAWLWSQYTWHAARCNAPEMARRPWHRKQAEWYYTQMLRDERALNDKWGGAPTAPTQWHREPLGSVVIGASARSPRPSPASQHSTRSDTRQSSPTSAPSG